MNYIEYTEKLIKEHCSADQIAAVLGPGYNVNSPPMLNARSGIKVVSPAEGEDICCWCNRYLHSDEFQLLDLVIMSRVLEHLELRSVDYYLYCISMIMKTNAKLIVTVPNMSYVVDELNKEWSIQTPNYDKLMRLNIELFSEGDDVMDRHSLFTNMNSVPKYLIKEGLFHVVSYKEVNVHTDCVPQELEFVAVKR